MVQFLKIHQYNPEYNETERKKKHMIILLDAQKACKNIPNPLHVKSMRAIRNTSSMQKLNRGNGQQASTQHQPKWKET